jgi:hypothetical protein
MGILRRHSIPACAIQGQSPSWNPRWPINRGSSTWSQVEPAQLSDLKPGAAVFIIASKQPDGGLTAMRGRVCKNGVKPPMCRA